MPSKPDRVGLWFYEACGTLSNGSAYCLYMKLHDNYRPGVQKLTNVVQDWGRIILNTGIGELPSRGTGIDQNKNSKTYLVFDSLYFDKATREYLRNTNINYTCSVKSDRCKEEIKFSTQQTEDKPGEYRSIYNPNTKELFTYAYDSDPNVGKKFNMSRGWIHSTQTLTVRQWRNSIPGYDAYKTMFQACDRFNRNLHDKTWPHKRGGNSVRGEFGCANDFIFGCILQNVFTTYCHIHNKDPKTVSFKQLCYNLSDEIFTYSNSLRTND